MYRNLTYKAVAALKWISIHCSHVDYAVKTDDDVFVNVFSLQTYIFGLHSTATRSRLVACHIWFKAKVMRTGKWAVSKTEVPDDLYPGYCGGLAYILTGDVIRAFYRMSLRVPFLWVDDVYVTGQLVKALGEQVTLIDIRKLYRLVIAKYSDLDKLDLHRSES